ncbi:MAG TPA: tRNA (adenosine(37)-N6)-threonylcarbamoyltransferase complex ATPase subunit type 1 TsaE, partial [Spirochaetota bacterium]|nr:tRNA (adenosine(37)-N6)-threonylcarbamoyltransferase complex ATPase subunit type 1 TsaE [Spirochaetota bacterium]
MYFFSASEQETAKIAAHLSELIFPGDNIKLTGKMGSGKSFLCRALIKHLGYNDIVPSPTFTLINQYNNIKKNNQIITIWHADMYRLAT